MRRPSCGIKSNVRPASAPGHSFLGNPAPGASVGHSMTPDASPPPRRRTLFLSYVYPSSGGVGPQIRAAGLLRAMARHEDIYLLVGLPREKTAGPCDPEMEKLCQKIEHVTLRRERESLPDGAGPSLAFDKMTIHEPIRRFYEENRLDSLFVFRLEASYFVVRHLDSFPRRVIDLDELVSRRLKMLDQVKAVSAAKTGEASDQRLQMATLIMERDLMQRYDKVFFSSPVEAEAARKLAPSAPIHVLPNVVTPPAARPASPATDPVEILFVGTFSHFPNVDAVVHFYREVFPLIRERMGGNILFRVIGAPVPDAFAEMINDPGVEVMGYQKDLGEWYARASLAVVPLRGGVGTRIKILEAFVHDRPVVSTTTGAGGLEIADGENILLADEPQAFAEACVRLLRDPVLAARLVAGGRRLQQARYSPEALQRSYEEAMQVPPARE